MTNPTHRPNIVVAGGGPAALEVLLTLSERLADRDTSVCLITPDQSFSYRPLSSVAEFATHRPHTLPLADLAARCNAQLIHESVVLVDEGNRRLLTRDGDWVPFDHLVLAVGARETPAPDRWLVWRASRDPSLLRDLVDGIAAKQIRTLAVVVPAHTGWPLAGYELALILGWAAKSTSSNAVVSLMSAEQRPLALFGSAAETAVDAELRRAGVEIMTGVSAPEPPEPALEFVAKPIAPRTSGRRRSSPAPPPQIDVLAGNERISFDRVVTLPANRGPGVGGLNVDERAYIRVDGRGRMLGSECVWAVGDCTALAVKHSALAIAQADAVADELAAALGAPVRPQPFTPSLTGILVTNAAEHWWAENAALAEDLEPATHCLWWPPGEVVGGRLAHYIAEHDPSARPYLLSHPGGTALSVTLALPSPAEVSAEIASARDRKAAKNGGREVEAKARRVDAHDRQLFAIHRLEQQGQRTLGELEQRLEHERADSQRILKRLNAAGYVVKDSHRSGAKSRRHRRA